MERGKREGLPSWGRPSLFAAAALELLRGGLSLTGSGGGVLAAEAFDASAVSTSFCLPVKNGWQAEQISRTMSPLWVERVSKWLPQAQRTLVFSYLGWMPSLGMVRILS